MRPSAPPPRHPRRALFAVLGGAGLLVVALAIVLVATFVAGSGNGSPGYTAQPAPTTPDAVAGIADSGSPSAGASASVSASSASGTPSASAAARGTTTGGQAPSGFPSAASTGVPANVSLRTVGDVTVTKNGTVISGLYVRGTLNVQADNVVVKNTRVTNNGAADWGIVQRQGHSGLVIQDSEIRGNGSQELQQAVLNFGGDITVRRTEISQVSDGVATVQGTIEDSYLHDPKVFQGDHVDMIQSTGNAPSGKSLVIQHNTIINTQGQTSVIALFQDFGVPHDVLITQNYLAGGGWSIYGGDGTKGTPTNIRITNNTFGRDVFPNCGVNGPIAYWPHGGSGNVWSGNVWAGSGAAVTP